MNRSAARAEKRHVVAILAPIEDERRWCLPASTVLRCYDEPSLLRALRDHACDLTVLCGDHASSDTVEKLRAAFPHVLTLYFSREASALRFHGRAGVWVAPPPPSANEFSALVSTLLEPQLQGDLRSSGIHIGTKVLVARQQRFEMVLDSITMAFQPIVSCSERRAVAFEGLLRTQAEGYSSPTALFEEAGRLDRVWDVSRVVRQRVAAASERAPEDALLFVNVHAQDIIDPWLLDERNPLLPLANRVVFELTEQADTSFVESLPRWIHALRARGYRVAIDDLGAGYSGLSALAEIEPEFVKIDMSIIRGVDRSSTKQRVIRSMATLANDLGSRMICEGVETLEEATALRALGADWLQGYYFARPAAEFAAAPTAIAWP